jgi:hypothetical protein
MTNKGLSRYITPANDVVVDARTDDGHFVDMFRIRRNRFVRVDLEPARPWRWAHGGWPRRLAEHRRNGFQFAVGDYTFESKDVSLYKPPTE